MSKKAKKPKRWSRVGDVGSKRRNQSGQRAKQDASSRTTRFAAFFWGLGQKNDSPNNE